MVIVLMLALVDKPTMTWTRMNMLRMLKDVTRNPLEKGIKQQVQGESWWADSAISCKGPTKVVMSRV